MDLVNTKKKLFLISLLSVFVSFAILCIADATHGASSNGQSRNFAIIIGVNDYLQNDYYSDLKYAVNDANAMAEFFSDKNGGLFSVSLLTTDQGNERFKPTRNNILNEVERVLGYTREGDSVLFFFSGHGGRDPDGEDYIFASDTGQNLKSGGISLQGLEEMLRNDEATVKIVFIDACRNQSVGKGSWNDTMEYGFSVGKGTFFMMSTESGKKSYEYDAVGMGVFTYVLELALSGEADSNNDRMVSFSEAKDFIAYKLMDVANEAKKPVQVPCMKGEYTGDIVLRKLDKVPACGQNEHYDFSIKQCACNDGYAFSVNRNACFSLSEMQTTGSPRTPPDSDPNNQEYHTIEIVLSAPDQAIKGSISATITIDNQQYQGFDKSGDFSASQQVFWRDYEVTGSRHDVRIDYTVCTSGVLGLGDSCPVVGTCTESLNISVNRYRFNCYMN